MHLAIFPGSLVKHIYHTYFYISPHIPVSFRILKHRVCSIGFGSNIYGVYFKSLASLELNPSDLYPRGLASRARKVQSSSNSDWKRSSLAVLKATLLNRPRPINTRADVGLCGRMQDSMDKLTSTCRQIARLN